MILKQFLFASTVTALVAGPAAAQMQWVNVRDQVQVAPLSANADTVDDWNVQTADGRKIGDVEEVIGTDVDTPTALVVDFDDEAGFDRRDDVIVPLDRFSLRDGRLVLDADAAAISSMQIYND